MSRDTHDHNGLHDLFSRGKHKKIHAQVVLDAQFHSLYRESQGSSENVVPEKRMNTPKQ